MSRTTTADRPAVPSDTTARDGSARDDTARKSPLRRGRKEGRTLTEVEIRILSDFANGFGTREDLAAELGKNVQHVSGIFNGRRRPSDPLWFAILRLIRDHAPSALLMLGTVGSEQTRDDVRSVRSVERVPTPIAGRGRAWVATLA